MVELLLALSLVSGHTDSAIGSAVAWTKHTIVVPAYGYFHKHGHCKTEDMVLYQVDYPDSIEFKCRHIDTF